MRNRLTTQLAWITQWLPSFSFALVKATFFILYYDGFYNFRWQRLGALIGGIVVVSVYLGVTAAILAVATPSPSKTWAQKATQAASPIGIRLSIPTAIWGIISDVYILLLPISGIVTLATDQKKKLGLFALYMSGIGEQRKIASVKADLKRSHCMLCRESAIQTDVHCQGFHLQRGKNGSPGVSAAELLRFCLIRLTASWSFVPGFASAHFPHVLH